jgi:hypothetical protein
LQENYKIAWSPFLAKQKVTVSDFVREAIRKRFGDEML